MIHISNEEDLLKAFEDVKQVLDEQAVPEGEHWVVMPDMPFLRWMRYYYRFFRASGDSRIQAGKMAYNLWRSVRSQPIEEEDGNTE